MPMLDAFIPEGALSEEAENRLLARLTDILLRSEGVDPSHPVARPLAYVWLHRPAKMFAGGELAVVPRYRMIASLPEGAYDDEHRSAMVAEVTEAVLDAEEGAYERDPARVYVFPNEIPEGTWGAFGRILPLAEIAGIVLGDAEKGRKYADRRRAPAPRGKVRQVGMPPALRASSTLSRIDYEEAFLVEAGPDDDRTAEQWARTMMEEAPVRLRRTLRRAWLALGLRLGPVRSDRFVLGWELRRCDPDLAVLGATGRLGLSAELLFARQEQALCFAGFVQLDNFVARMLWRRIVPRHRQVVQHLLKRSSRATCSVG